MKRSAFLFVFAAFSVFFLFLKPVPAVGEGTATPSPAQAFQKLVDVGGYKLLINCRGQGSPVVMLESGSGADTGSWESIPVQVGEFSTVCVYDRAGVGKSQPRLKAVPVGVQALVSDLHTLMTNTGLKMPVVLVGFSLGGAVVRIYGSTYPDDVAGMVLLDAVDSDLLNMTLDAYHLQMLEDGKTTLDPQKFAGDFRSADPFPNIPLVVLRHDPAFMELPSGVDVTGYEAKWLNAQISLSQLSPQGTLIMAKGSGHNIINGQPQLVVSAIRNVVDTIRNGKDAPTLTPFWTQIPTYEGTPVS